LLLVVATPVECVLALQAVFIATRPFVLSPSAALVCGFKTPNALPLIAKADQVVTALLDVFVCVLTTTGDTLPDAKYLPSRIILAAQQLPLDDNATA
jgi:hypothetical protein